ncbi:DUF4398 domain-containing protein [Ectothiorhodospira mobilis]|uniref:DUF4398 domain-containing protein n=1 Tax=Ectothiorhodospira mobilis TaxID=195064 RepID=UPI001EE846EC|nr:DUF4398 domain-containing protein [Ectothiorhodospira mobilis]
MNPIPDPRPSRSIRPGPLCCRTYGAVALLLWALMAGCATTAPVQEMSDARQALQAAEQAGARERAAEAYRRSRALLEEAQLRLESGEYGPAREKALEAKRAAIEARIEAAD